jgi:aspartate racemase
LASDLVVTVDDVPFGECIVAEQRAAPVILSSPEERATTRRLVRGGCGGPDTRPSAVILGCTEIGLLIRAEDAPVPVFDATKIDAEAAVEYALKP